MASDAGDAAERQGDEMDASRRDHLREVYDPDPVSAVDAWHPNSPFRDAAPTSRRGPRGLGMALLAGTTLGLRESFENEGDHEALVELDPETDVGEQWITFIHVPGSPRASRIVIRPWLAPSREGSR